MNWRFLKSFLQIFQCEWSPSQDAGWHDTCHIFSRQIPGSKPSEFATGILGYCRSKVGVTSYNVTTSTLLWTQQLKAHLKPWCLKKWFISVLGQFWGLFFMGRTPVKLSGPASHWSSDGESCTVLQSRLKKRTLWGWKTTCGGKSWSIYITQWPSVIFIQHIIGKV